MDEVARFFGWFCISMVALGGACAMLALAMWTGEKLVGRFENAGARRARADAGMDIISIAHWFSTDMPTVGLLKHIGEQVRDGYQLDASETRARWQRASMEEVAQP